MIAIVLLLLTLPAGAQSYRQQMDDLRDQQYHMQMEIDNQRLRQQSEMEQLRLQMQRERREREDQQTIDAWRSIDQCKIHGC